jgi:hypothetical protein
MVKQRTILSDDPPSTQIFRDTSEKLHVSWADLAKEYPSLRGTQNHRLNSDRKGGISLITLLRFMLLIAEYLSPVLFKLATFLQHLTRLTHYYYYYYFQLRTAALRLMCDLG